MSSEARLRLDKAITEGDVRVIEDRDRPFAFRPGMAVEGTINGALCRQGMIMPKSVGFDREYGLDVLADLWAATVIRCSEA